MRCKNRRRNPLSSSPYRVFPPRSASGNHRKPNFRLRLPNSRLLPKSGCRNKRKQCYQPLSRNPRSSRMSSCHNRQRQNFLKFPPNRELPPMPARCNQRRQNPLLSLRNWKYRQMSNRNSEKHILKKHIDICRMNLPLCRHMP